MAHLHDHPAVVLPSRRTATGTSPTRATTPPGGLALST